MESKLVYKYIVTEDMTVSNNCKKYVKCCTTSSQ